MHGLVAMPEFVQSEGRRRRSLRSSSSSGLSRTRTVQKGSANDSELGGMEWNVRRAESMGPVRVLQGEPATTHMTLRRCNSIQQALDNTILNFGDAFFTHEFWNAGNVPSESIHLI